MTSNNIINSSIEPQKQAPKLEGFDYGTRFSCPCSNKVRNVILGLVLVLVIGGTLAYFVPGSHDWIAKTALPKAEHFFKNLTLNQGLAYFVIPFIGAVTIALAAWVYFRRHHEPRELTLVNIPEIDFKEMDDAIACLEKLKEDQATESVENTNGKEDSSPKEERSLFEETQEIDRELPKKLDIWDGASW